MTELIEEWNPVGGYEWYEISDIGRVRNKRTGRILKPPPNKGYLKVGLYRDGDQTWFLVHRLVAQAFIHNPDNLPEVNRINGNKTDNRAVNLEWCTSSDNHKHAHRTGLKSVSRKQIESVKMVRSKGVICPGLKREFCSAREAARQTGISCSNISLCCLGKRRSAGKHPETEDKLTWHFIERTACIGNTVSGSGPCK